MTARVLLCCCALVVSAELRGGFVSSGGLSPFPQALGSPFGDTLRFGSLTLHSGPAALFAAAAGTGDRTSPLLTLISNSAPPVRNANLFLSFRASDSGSGLRSVLFRYRPGGERTWRTDTLRRDNGLFNRAIPGAYLTERGFAWSVEAIDSSGNMSVYPAVADSPESQSLRMPSGLRFSVETGAELPPDRWHMISAPCRLDAPDASALFSPLLGPHDARRWKLTEWNGSRYVSASEALPLFSPGRALLVYARGNPFDYATGPARTLPVDAPFAVVLPARQWTAVATPFAFPVAWRDCFASDSQRLRLNLPLPLSGDLIGGEWPGLDPDPVLLPWKGYWVHNPNATTCTLFVHPFETTPKTGRNLLSDGFAMGLQCANSVRSVFSAVNSFEKCLPLPPVPGNDPVLYFSDQDTAYIFQSTSPDKLSGSGRVCAMQLDFRGGVSALVTAEFRGAPPQAVRLLSDASLAVIDLLTQTSVNLSKPEGSDTLKLSLIAGTVSFADSVLAFRAAHLPSAFFALSAEPNPFNPVVRIRFGLPSGTLYSLSLNILNASGQIIKTLKQNSLSPGFHSLVWDGRNVVNTPAPSGLYFYKLRADGKGPPFTRSGKMVLTR